MNNPSIYKYDNSLEIREDGRDIDVSVWRDSELCIEIDEHDSGYNHDHRAMIFLSKESQVALRDFLNEVVKS